MIRNAPRDAAVFGVDLGKNVACLKKTATELPISIPMPQFIRISALGMLVQRRIPPIIFPHLRIIPPRRNPAFEIISVAEA